MYNNFTKNTSTEVKKPLSKGKKHLLSAFYESGAHTDWVAIPHQTLGSRAASYHDNKKAYTRWFALRANPLLVSDGYLEIKKQKKIKVAGILIDQPLLYRLTTLGSREAKYYHQEFVAQKAEKSAIIFGSKKVTLKTLIVIKDLKLLGSVRARAREEREQDLKTFTRKYKDDALAIDILKSFKNLSLSGRYSLLRFPSKVLKRVTLELSNCRNIAVIYKRCLEICLEEGFYPDHDFSRTLVKENCGAAFRPLIEIYFDDVEDKKKKYCAERKRKPAIQQKSYIAGSIRPKDLDKDYKNSTKWIVKKTDVRSLRIAKS